MKLLIIDELHHSIHSLLSEKNIAYDYLPKITKDECLEIIHLYEGLLLRSKFDITKEVINKAEKLKFIARAGAGLDNIDVEYAQKKSISVFGANEGNRVAVAEQTIGMLLSLMNNIVKSHNEILNLEWKREENRGFEIEGKTVAIIGYGNIGKQVAKRLFGFNCNVISYDKYLFDYSDEYVKESTMEDVFQTADIVTLHIPLTHETIGLVDFNFLSKFEKPIWLVNNARGKILKLSDLKLAFDKQIVKGAALDVLENENLHSYKKTNPEILDFIFNNSKILLTPHVAGWSFESYFKINKVIVEKIYSYIYA